MALSGAYLLSVMSPVTSLMSLDTAGTFPAMSCSGYDPMISIKTEPVYDNSLDTSYMDTTYTELSTANLSQIKQGQTDIYRDNMTDSSTFASWMYLHPENWGPKEVLDWVFFLTETENLDGAHFRGEAYQNLSGEQLCSMKLGDFLAIDHSYGKMVYDIFHTLLNGSNFKKPSPPEMFQPETLGNVPDFDFLDSSVDSRPSRLTACSSPAASDKQLSVILDQNVVKVNVDGFMYDIFEVDNTAFPQIDDTGYISGSEGDMDRSSSMSPNNDVFNIQTDDEESLDLESCRKSPNASVSSDSGCEGGDEKRTPTRRRPASTSKGNHLWEFVRDLLKDPRFNPSLLKWEDKEEGVFKFVQSEAVAQMWGRKKNNPGMTYEKLSRAMRFCRSAGYFDSVPKTGRFPKKLCFKFGKKASGWRD